MKRDGIAGFPGPWELDTIHMYMHLLSRSISGLGRGQVWEVKMRVGLGNDNSEGGHRGWSPWSDGRGDSYPGLT